MDNRIQELLQKLASTGDQGAKRKLRQQLRKLGHRGGINGTGLSHAPSTGVRASKPQAPPKPPRIELYGPPHPHEQGLIVLDIPYSNQPFMFGIEWGFVNIKGNQLRQMGLFPDAKTQDDAEAALAYVQRKCGWTARLINLNRTTFRS